MKGIEGIDCISLAGKLSLEETAALIKEVGTIITVNTGIMHCVPIVNDVYRITWAYFTI